MAEKDPLIELYVERHPREAAAILNLQGPADVGEVVEALDPDHAAVLLADMTTDAVAACLMSLPADRAASHLGNLPTRTAAAILRQIDDGQRADLLQAMPTATRIQVEMMMRQPSHRIGAWIETRIITIAEGTAADAARRTLAKAAHAEGDIYVVDAAGALAGLVTPARLIGLRAKQSIDEAARPPRAVLNASTSIEAALAEPAWTFVDTLPVVDRTGKLLGSVRQSVLRRALVANAEPGAGKKDTAYMNMADTIYVGLAGVLATSISRSPQATPESQVDGSDQK